MQRDDLFFCYHVSSLEYGGRKLIEQPAVYARFCNALWTPHGQAQDAMTAVSDPKLCQNEQLQLTSHCAERTIR